MAVRLTSMAAGQAAMHARAGAARTARRLRGNVTCGAEPTDFDPLDPEVVADPYPAYRELLRGPAVHHNRRRALWIISHYDEVRAAGRAHDSLSSAESVARYRARLPMMLTVDRPEHTRLRRMVASDFTREAIGRLRPAIEPLTREAIDDMLSDGVTDAVRRLASPLPVAVIARVLGVPSDDLYAFRDWSDRIVDGFAAEPKPGALRSNARVLGATVELRAYLAEQVRRRRDPGGDDLLSRLANSELSEDELFWFGLMLLVAGNETTTNLLGTMLLAFAEHPDQWAKVRADPGLVSAAVEEALRHVSPIQGLYRTAASEYHAAPAAIPAGGRVLLLFGAANRDPRHYADPERFLVERNPTDHVAFGSGIHFCLGAHLARLEAALVLRELAPRVEAIELAGEPEWSGNPALRGLARLPLRLVPT
jgi:cytochrome P450